MNNTFQICGLLLTDIENGVWTRGSTLVVLFM